LEGDHITALCVATASVDGPEVIGQAEPIAGFLAGKVEARELAALILGIEENQGVAG
jgi:hypothetical protein